MLVAQIIPSIVRQAVAQLQLENLARSIIDRNQDVKAAKESFKNQGKPSDEAALEAVNRNPDIKNLIREESFNEL